MAFLITLLLLVPAMIWRGFVLSIIWNWFMVPIFNLPSLGIAAAIGVALVIQVFNGIEIENNLDTEAESEAKLVIAAIVKLFFAPLVMLFVAWMVKLCM